MYLSTSLYISPHISIFSLMCTSIQYSTIFVFIRWTFTSHTYSDCESSTAELAGIEIQRYIMLQQVNIFPFSFTVKMFDKYYQLLILMLLAKEKVQFSIAEWSVCEPLLYTACNKMGAFGYMINIRYLSYLHVLHLGIFYWCIHLHMP